MPSLHKTLGAYNEAQHSKPGFRSGVALEKLNTVP